MSMRQNIYNESDNLSSSFITTKYYVEPDEKSMWAHRDIEYNKAGVPVLRLYKGEQKKVYKKVFVNGVETKDIELKKPTLPFEYLGQVTENEFGVIINGTSLPKYTVIRAVNEGSKSMPNDMTGKLLGDYEKVNDVELLVIVEPEPIVTHLKWGHPNPLILYSLDPIPLSLKTIYSNGQEYEITHSALRQLIIASSNPYVVSGIQKGLIKPSGDGVYDPALIVPHHFDERALLHITFDSLKTAFNDGIKPIEPLTIIISKDIKPELLLTANFSVEYEKELPLIDVQSTYNIFIYNKYELTTGDIIRHDISSEYIFRLVDNAPQGIVDTDIANNTLYPKSVGETQIYAMNLYVNEQSEEFSGVPKIITWDVKITRTLHKIEWNIDNARLFIGQHQGTLNVTAYYTDDTIEDISNSCSFNYNSKYVKIEENKVIPIAPGTFELSISTRKSNGELLSDKIVTMKIIQPITNMKLNKHKLELLVHDEETLDFVYEPDNATPMELEWTSTDSNIVSVNSKGEIKVLDRGSADIILTARYEDEPEVENENEYDIEYEKEYNNDSKIYLPKNLEISATTNSNGLAEIKLLDSTLYYIKLYDFKRKAISDANITYLNKDNQTLSITLQSETLISYDKTIYAEVSNFYNDKVYTMPITVYLQNNGEIIDTIITETNKQGIATIQSLNKAFTDENGLVIIDGIRVQIKYINDYISNVEINHEEKSKLIITTPLLDIDTMKKLTINIMDADDVDEDEVDRKVLDNFEIKVYNKDILIFNDYISSEEIILDSSDEVNELDDKNIDDFYNEENIVTNLLEYNPTTCAICKVIARAIDATSIRFKHDIYTIDVDDFSIPLEVEIEPVKTSFKDYRIVIENTDIAKFNSINQLYGYQAGNTKIKVILNDNPEIFDEANVIVTDYRLQSVKIQPGNDTDYEWYDNLNQQKYYTDAGRYITSGNRVTAEKYDDDDINRYYLPVNNSLQLSAIVYPVNANNKELKWLSSDSNLVRVNEKGIITAIREGKQELDVYGDDNFSETRFANTVWITAINTRYRKYDVCQVRVTRNKILAINIPKPNEHDYDVDDILSNGEYDPNAEHEFDYVIRVGETVKIPIKLSTQDASFGTSDSLKWYGSRDVTKIVELSNISPDHANAKNDEFDWYITTPDVVNKNKNSYDLEVTGVGIGDTYIYALPYDNVRDVTQKQLYVPEETYIVETSKNGIARLDEKYGIKKIRIDWFSKKSTIISEYKNSINNQLKELKDEKEVIIAGSKVIENGVNILDDIIDDKYIATRGLPVNGAKCMINPNGSIKIIIPETCKAKNITTTTHSQSMPLTFDFKPVIDSSGVFNEDDNGNETLNIEQTDEYIMITLYDVNGIRRQIPIFVDAIVNDNDKHKYKSYALCATTTQNPEDELFNSISYFPASETISKKVVEDIGDPFNARPGMGTWVAGPKSRKVRIRVVATPKRLNIGWVNAYDNELASINAIETNTITRNKWSKKDYRYMAIGYDDEFKELLKNADARNAELAEKYKSFAWFSDNEEVIRFEDVENLDYKTEDGKNTNDPNENYQQVKSEPVTIHFKNLDASDYDGYRFVNSITDIKFGDTYNYNEKEQVAVDNTNMCILKLTAPVDGRFLIKHTGKIQYDTNESFTDNPKILTAKDNVVGGTENSVYANRGDVIYVKGATSTQVYISNICYYENEVGPGYWGGPHLYIKDNSPSAYVEYKDMFSLRLPNDDAYEYTSDDGIVLYNENSGIKFTPKYDANITITFSGKAIKLQSSRETSTINASASPCTKKVYAGVEYTIVGTDMNGSTISSIEYTSIIEGEHTGSLKHTDRFTVKPSYMKRVICEGKGTARIYVLSPKGEALINMIIHIK